MHEDEQGRIIPPGNSAVAASGGGSLVERVFFWAVLVVCVALLIGAVGEIWTHHTIDQQSAAIRASNAALTRDVAATRQTISVAESPAVIDREARSWGYVRPGDHLVIIVPAR